MKAPPLVGAATSSPLDTPTGVAVDKDGKLYIADTGNNKVEVVAGGNLSVVAGAGHAAAPAAGLAVNSPLSGPEAVAVDATGTVYIADTGNHVVEKVTPAGQLTVLGTVGGAAGTPTGIAVDRFGTVFVADPAGDAVQQFTGGTPSALSITSGTPTTLADPRGLAVDATGAVRVAETGADRVRTLTSTAAAAAPRVTSAAPTMAPVKAPGHSRSPRPGPPPRCGRC